MSCYTPTHQPTNWCINRKCHLIGFDEICSIKEVFAALDVIQYQRPSFRDGRELYCRISHPERLVQILQNWAGVEIHKALQTRFEQKRGRAEGDGLRGWEISLALNDLDSQNQLTDPTVLRYQVGRLKESNDMFEASKHLASRPNKVDTRASIRAQEKKHCTCRS